MGSQFEGLIGMMCGAVVGGILAVIVHAAKSPIALTGFAYVGTHVVTAGMLIVPFAFACFLLKMDPPPYALWSMLLFGVFPAIISVTMVANVYWPDPTSKPTMGASWIGAVAFPYLLLRIGGTAIESWVTREKRDRTKW